MTPLQFVDAVGGLVRDGTHVPLTLLKRDPAALPARTRYISAHTAETLRWLMWLVIEHGTGTRAHLPTYSRSRRPDTTRCRWV